MRSAKLLSLAAIVVLPLAAMMIKPAAASSNAQCTRQYGKGSTWNPRLKECVGSVTSPQKITKDLKAEEEPGRDATKKRQPSLKRKPHKRDNFRAEELQRRQEAARKAALKPTKVEDDDD